LRIFTETEVRHISAPGFWSFLFLLAMLLSLQVGAQTVSSLEWQWFRPQL